MQENIDDIIKEMRQIRPDCDDCISNHVCGYLSRFADRLDAAYKCEIKSQCESWWRDKLIQANMIERNKKTKKKYEYAWAYNRDGIMRDIGGQKDCIERIVQSCVNVKMFRRTVGKWEEVK